MPVTKSRSRRIALHTGVLLVLHVCFACADEHRAAMTGPDDDAHARDPEMADLSDTGRPDATAAPERADVDCGAAGPPLSGLDRFTRREQLCRRPSELSALDGSVYGTEAASTSCPAPAEIRWPGGGERCWWDPVCNNVEARAVDAGEGVLCCYDVQMRCGV